jgi:hypothetical protein
MNYLEEKTVKANVHYHNEMQKIINARIGLVMNVLARYKGGKVVKAAGTNNQALTKAPANDLADLSKDLTVKPLHEGHYASIQYFAVRLSYSSLYLELSLNFNGGKYEDRSYYCAYPKESIFLGEFDRSTGVLTKMIDSYTPQPERNAEEELAKYKQVEALKEAFENAQRELLIVNQIYRVASGGNGQW